MNIREKSKEELLNQAELFFEYEKKKWKLDEKTEKEILKILWLNEDEKMKFLERLSKKLWKQTDINNKSEIEKALKKKHINFNEIWEEYTEYLKLRSKEEHKNRIRENIKKLFDSYKTPFKDVNEKIIKLIVENYSKDIIEKTRIFLSHNCIKIFTDEDLFKYYILWDINYDNLEFLLNNFKLWELRIIAKSPITIQYYKDGSIITTHYYNIQANDIDTIKNNVSLLKKYWFDYTALNLNELKDENIRQYIEIISNCDIEWFWKDFNQENEDDELENIFLEYKNSTKEEILKKCIDYWFCEIDRILSKTPEIDYEQNRWYSIKSVHMFWMVNNNNDKMARFLAWKSYDPYDNRCDSIWNYGFLAYLRTVYWTNNWRENINLVYEKGLIDSKEIVDMWWWNNEEITYLKTIKNEILEKLLRNWVNREDFNIFVTDLQYLNYDNLTILLNKWPDITINNLNSMKKILKSLNSECLKMILDKRDNITKEELIWLANMISLSNEGSYELLKIIFEKYPNISYKEFQVLKLKWFWYIDKYPLWFDIPNLCECIKILIEFYPDITIKQLSSINLKATHSINNWFKYGTLSWFLKYFGPVELMDLNKYKKLLGAYLSWLVPEFKEVNKLWYVKYIEEIIDTYYDSNKKVEMIKKICTLTFNEAENYLKIFKMFDESISMDIKRIRNELIDEILKADNPEEVAKSINDIFEKNNLPLTWKIFKVFELLYPIDKFRSTLQPHWSPILHQYLDKWKNVYSLIYKDLMNIAIKSWDRSLKEYISTFIWSENLIKNFEEIVSKDWFNRQDSWCLEWKISEEEQEKLLYLFRKISVLYTRYFWKKINEWNSIENIELWKYNIYYDTLIQLYNDIKKWFHLKKWESIYDRLQRFLYWLGYRSFQEVLNEMDNSKKNAHEKWLKLYNESIWWKIVFPKQVFLKWVQRDAFQKIVNRWVTCREYLWWWEDWNAAWSDATPFDIDWIFVDAQTNWTSYWNINLVIDTTKWNIYDTKKEWVEWYTEDKYELFETWGWHHYWIRTWIPMTEVDYIIYHWDYDKKEFQDMCYEIARNGYYIPIADNNGNIKFTPEMYHKIRLWFNYLEYYDWFDVELKDGRFVSKENDDKVHKNITDIDIIELIKDNSPQNEKYVNFAKENKELAKNTIEWIKRILEEKCWIKFNSKYDSSITWAELHDSWSTWRWTDIPTKDVDLDFTLLLDAKDYEKIDEITRIIHEAIWTQFSKDHDVSEWWNQIKSKINNIWKSDERPNGVPLDLLILKKSQVIEYSSSDAMNEKLNYIASNPETWSEDWEWVRTNIIIMKKLLKAKWCYKKPEWWISGIWVENWITQNHWNFIEALESFEQVAYWWKYEKWKQPLSLYEFQKLYPIYDAGENYKNWGNDNFVYKLEENGYQGTLEIIKTYRLEWIDWIKRLIKEYEQKKAQFIEQ